MRKKLLNEHIFAFLVALLCLVAAVTIANYGIIGVLSVFLGYGIGDITYRIFELFNK